MRLTPPPRATTLARFAPLIVGVVAFVVYARTLLPGMAFGDWGEMQTVPHVLGVAHPTGYPTYILLSWLAQLVPLGSIAFRANLLSAVLVSGALAVGAAILLRIGVRPVFAVAAALAVGAVPTVWSAATVAEVNALHLLFVVLLLHRALVWEERRATRDLVLGALLLGLAAGNHLLILFVAPFLLAHVLWVGRREVAARPGILVLAAGAGILGLAVYLYIPLAASQAPPLPYNHPTTLESVLWLVSGAQFRGQFNFLTPSGLTEFVGSLPALWSLAVRHATPVLPILGAIGLVVFARRRPAFGLTCVAILVTNVYIWANYLQLEHYLLVPWLLLGLGAGMATESAARALDGAIGQLVRRPVGRGLGRALGATALIFAVALGAMNWQASDRSADRSAEVYVDALLAALPRDAAILTEWDVSTPLWHAQLVLGRRQDILVVDDTNIVYDGWGTREQRIASLICDRPVYALRIREDDLAATRAEYRVEPVTSMFVALGGPSAAVTRTLFQVKPFDPGRCPG